MVPTNRYERRWNDTSWSSLVKNLVSLNENILFLFTAEQRDEWDSTGQIAYEKACKKYGVIVSSTFHNKLRYANSIDLGYYGVGVAGAKAIAVAFCVSIAVELLDVETLGLGREGLGLEWSLSCMWSYFLCTYSRQLSTQATIFMTLIINTTIRWGKYLPHWTILHR